MKSNSATRLTVWAWACPRRYRFRPDLEESACPDWPRKWPSMGRVRLTLAGLVIDRDIGRGHFRAHGLITRGLPRVLAGVMRGSQILVADVPTGLKGCRHIEAEGEI